MFVPGWSYTLTERNPDWPWLVIGSEYRTITLADDQNFSDWAPEHWPEPRRSVQLGPWQL
jgi:hypothetical protein